MQPRPRVVIIGGGISGLATAHYLRRSLGDALELTVIEGSQRLGGKIATERFGGHLIDCGPDALLVQPPVMVALIDDLGLRDEMVPPAVVGAHIWSRGHLRRIPAGTLFGVPDRVIPVLKSRLLSPAGLARAAMDLVLPRRRAIAPDPSIADMIIPRLGSQVFERLVEPLLSGIFAARASDLSARSTVPDIDVLARNNRSLYLGLRRKRRAAPPTTGGPPLMSINGGLVRLVEALSEHLADADLRLGSAADDVARDGTGYRVRLSNGHSIEADAVVLATPAYVTAPLLADLAPAAAKALDEVPYADVATILLAYPRASVKRRLNGSGFLVPPKEGKLLVGCTWSSVKWSHLANDSVVLVRAMVGRHGDRRWMAMDEDTLVSSVHEELAAAMDLTTGPVEHQIVRWTQGIPQYVVGHQGRLDTIDAALADLPGLYTTGSAYRGVGLASCVAAAEKTAEDVVLGLTDVRPLAEVAS